MDKVHFEQMIQKQQLNLIKLQKRLDEMKREYKTYQQMIQQIKNQLTSEKLDKGEVVISPE